MREMEHVCVCSHRESRKELVPRTIGPGSHSSAAGAAGEHSGKSPCCSSIRRPPGGSILFLRVLEFFCFCFFKAFN